MPGVRELNWFLHLPVCTLFVFKRSIFVLSSPAIKSCVVSFASPSCSKCQEGKSDRILRILKCSYLAAELHGKRMNFEANRVWTCVARIMNDGHKVMESLSLNPATVFVWIAFCGRAKEVCHICEPKERKIGAKLDTGCCLQKGRPAVSGCNSRSISADCLV